MALTHKASPPSRPNSEPSSLPRSPPSSTSSQQAQSQPQQRDSVASQQPPLAVVPAVVAAHQAQPVTTTPTTVSSQQQPYAAHNQHLKQELAVSPKQEGFDLSKSASSTGEYLFFLSFFSDKGRIASSVISEEKIYTRFRVNFLYSSCFMMIVFTWTRFRLGFLSRFLSLKILRHLLIQILKA